MSNARNASRNIRSSRDFARDHVPRIILMNSNFEHTFLFSILYSFYKLYCTGRKKLRHLFLWVTFVNPLGFYFFKMVADGKDVCFVFYSICCITIHLIKQLFALSCAQNKSLTRKFVSNLALTMFFKNNCKHKQDYNTSNLPETLINEWRKIREKLYFFQEIVMKRKIRTKSYSLFKIKIQKTWHKKMRIETEGLIHSSSRCRRRFYSATTY